MSKTIITHQKSHIDTQKDAIFKGSQLPFPSGPSFFGFCFVRMNKAVQKPTPGAREDHLHDLLLYPNVQFTEDVPWLETDDSIVQGLRRK